MSSDDLQARLAEARLAMEGEERRKKREEQEKILAAGRAKARFAMEGDERRRSREKKETEDKEKEEIKRRIDEDVRKQKAEEEKRKREVEEAMRREEAADELKRNEKISRIQESEKELDNLKKEGDSHLNTFRTIDSDTARAIEEARNAINKIPIEDPSSGSWSPEPKVGRKKTIAILITIFILVGSASALSYFAYLKKTAPNTVSIQNLTDPIVFSEKNYEINLSHSNKDAAVKQIASLLVDKNIRNGDIINILLTKVVSSSNPKSKVSTIANAGSSDLKRGIGLEIPADLEPYLKKDFMLGVFGSNPNTLFLMLKVNSYDNGAKAIALHENDFVKSIFPSISGSTVTPAIGINSFVDKTIRNIDTRVVMGDDDQIKLIYSFIDRETVLITTGENEFIKILDAYNTPKPRI